MESGLDRRTRASRVARLLDDALGLVLPVECPGCGVWDTALCESCRGLLDAVPTRCEQGAPALAGLTSEHPLLPTWAIASYAGPVRGLVVAWKREPRAALSRAVSGAARRAGRAWAGEVLGPLAPALDLWVVPAPSGWRRRAQGRFVVGDLASAVAEGLAVGRGASEAQGLVRAADVLRRAPGRAHQSGLGVAGRAANRRGGTRVRPGLPDGVVCVLVDDVLTTGATLAAARGALVEAGHTVLGALVVAAAPAPRGRS